MSRNVSAVAVLAAFLAGGCSCGRSQPSPPTIGSVKLTATSPVVADGRVTGALVATVLDDKGQPFSGQTVKLGSSRAGDTVVQPASATDAKGVASGTIASTTRGDAVVTASSGGKSATATVHFTAAGPPTIESFSATPPAISAGAASTLAWTVRDASALSIDQSVGDVTGKTSTAVSPAATTKYTLTATNEAGSATASVTVTVGSGVKYELGGLPAGAAAGDALAFDLTVKDDIGNVLAGYTGTVHFTSTDPQATLPADYAFAAADAGKHAFSVTFKTAGNDVLAATDLAAPAVTASQTVAGAPGPTAALLVSGIPSPTSVGTPDDVTMEGRDAFGNLTPGYLGTVHFTSSDGAATLPADYAFTAADKGKHVFGAAVVFATTGTQSVTATDTASAAITGTQANIAVGAGGGVHLVVAGIPSPRAAGIATSVTVTAKDSLGNTVTTYAGTVHFTSSDGAAVLPADYSFTAGDGGVHAFAGVTLKTAGTQLVRATDVADSSITGAQTGILVNPAGATGLELSVIPSTVGAGTAATVTVTARDGFANVATGYTGTVNFTSTDLSATLPANYPFLAGDAGVHAFPVTFNALGTQTVTATDTITASITGTSNAVTVNCGARTIDASKTTVVATAGCLGVSTGALSGIEVDLKDAAGVAITGATVTLSVAASGLTFPAGPFQEAGAPTAIEGTTGGGKGRYFLTLQAPNAGSGSITVSATASWPACGVGATPITQSAAVTTAAPNAFATSADGGGVGGCPAGKNLRVRVVQSEAAANGIAGALVMAGGAPNAASFHATMADYVNGAARSVSNVATADGNGVVELHDFAPTSPLAGPVPVTAVDSGGARAYGTLWKLDAADLVMPLRLLHPSQPTAYQYSQQTTGTVTSWTVPNCTNIKAGIAAADVDIDFFGSFDTSFLGRDQCISGPTGPVSFPQAFYVPSQNVSGVAGVCIFALGPGLFTVDLAGSGRAMSLPAGSLPFNTVTASGVTTADLLADITLTHLGFHTGISGPPSTPNVNTSVTDTYPGTLSFNFASGFTRPGGTDVPDLVALTGADISNGSNPAGSGRLLLTSLKALRGSSALASIPVSVPDLTNGSAGNPASSAPFAAVAAVYIGKTTPAANKKSAASGKFFRQAPFVFGSTSTTNLAVGDLLELPVADLSADNRRFQWSDTRTTLSSHYSRSDLVLETVTYPALNACEKQRQAMSSAESQWVVWKPYDTADAACAGSECFSLPTLPAGWPRAGDGLQQLSGFEQRTGSGKGCTTNADCQASLGESCNNIAASGQTANNLCTLTSGTDFVVHRNRWDLVESVHGLAPSFDPRRFAFGTRSAQVTHIASNRRELTRCASSADCTAPAVCDQTMSCR